MGMRKKGSRLITVDGVQYRFHVIANRGYRNNALWVAIQRVDPTGQRLMTNFKLPILLEPHEVWQAVTPAVVRQLIEGALARGWQPAVNGLGAFQLQSTDVVKELPDAVRHDEIDEIPE